MADFKRGKIVAAIRLEMINNTLGLLINEFEHNTDSMGVDLNCRSIIEASSLIKMLQSNDLSDEVVAKFCFYNQYRILIFKKEILKDNPIFDDFGLNELKEITKNTSDEYEKQIEDLIAKYQEVFSMTKEETIEILKARDPLLIGKNTFGSITHRYLGDEYYSLRRFFSFGVHPFYFHQVDIDFRNGMKLKLITRVLELVEDMLNEIDIDINGIQSYQQYKKNKQEVIDTINKVCEAYGNSKKGFGGDGYFRCYVSQRKSMIKDCALMALFSIDLQFQCKYKIFIELFAMHEKMTESMTNGKDHANKFADLFKANSYYNFSRILNEHVLYNSPDLRRITDNLKEDVDKYTTEALEISEGIAKEDLLEGFANNPLFFINFDKKQTIIETINYLIVRHIDGEGMGMVMKAIYDISASIDHPSGLIFDSSSSIFVDYNTTQLYLLMSLYEASIFGLAAHFIPENGEYLKQQFIKFTDKNKNVFMAAIQNMIERHSEYTFEINKYSDIYDDLATRIREF